MGRLTYFFAVALVVGAHSEALGQERPIVMIDPGHGGDQVGVEAEGILEKDLVLRAGFILAEEYVSRGYDVRLTRTGDYDLPFNDRRIMAEDAGAVLFVSLHINGDEDPTATGIEIYANPDNAPSTAAANHVAEELGKMGVPVVVEARDWGFLASESSPTVMIEAGFLTNPVERRIVVTTQYYRDLATSIADATDAFLAERH